MITTVKVLVAGQVKTYKADIAGLGDHLAGGGEIGNLLDFIASAKRTIKSSDFIKSVRGWVWLDDSGLAYHIDVMKSGHYSILSAAPRSEIRDVYDARGY